MGALLGRTDALKRIKGLEAYYPGGKAEAYLVLFYLENQVGKCPDRPMEGLRQELIDTNPPAAKECCGEGCRMAWRLLLRGGVEFG